MPSEPLVVSVALPAHLTLAALDEALAEAQPLLEGAPPKQRVVLVVNALAMTRYDSDARQRFVEFNAATRQRVERVAILTENRLWVMVIAAMSLASGQKMRGFPTQEAALPWLSDTEVAA